MYCNQEVRRKSQVARFVGTLERRSKLWWSGNDAGFGRVGILVKEEIPAQWCSGESVLIAVGRPGAHSLCLVIPKNFKN